MIGAGSARQTDAPDGGRAIAAPALRSGENALCLPGRKGHRAGDGRARYFVRAGPEPAIRAPNISGR